MDLPSTTTATSCATAAGTTAALVTPATTGKQKAAPRMTATAKSLLQTTIKKKRQTSDELAHAAKELAAVSAMAAKELVAAEANVDIMEATVAPGTAPAPAPAPVHPNTAISTATVAGTTALTTAAPRTTTLPVPAAVSAPGVIGTKPGFIVTLDPLDARVRQNDTNPQGDIQTLASFKNFPYNLLRDGRMIDNGGLMTRLPRADDDVQVSIQTDGFRDITQTALVIVEWPVSQGENTEYANYPAVPLREHRLTHDGEPELDFLDPGDKKTWKDLRIDERRWVIVDGNNRQSGIKTAIAQGSPLVPVCTRLICLYTVPCLCKILLCSPSLSTLRYVCSISTRALKLAAECS